MSMKVIVNEAAIIAQTQYFSNRGFIYHDMKYKHV